MYKKTHSFTMTAGGLFMPSSVDTQQLAHDWAAQNLKNHILDYAERHTLHHMIESRIMRPLGLGTLSALQTLEVQQLSAIKDLLKHLPVIAYAAA
jgi:hypothetical protein